MMKYVAGLVVALASIGLMGCSGGAASDASTDGGGGGASAITISGSIASNDAQVFSGVNDPFAISPSDLQLYGIAFSNPPVISTVDVGSDGSFSLTLAAADDTPISLIFKMKQGGDEVGVVKFEDSTKKDMSGNNKKSTSVPLRGAVSLGNLNLANGEVTVPVTQIASNVGNTDVAATTAFNFAGYWNLSSFSGTLPSGYVDPFAAGSCPEHNDPQAACFPSGMSAFPITIIRFVGKEFTPTASGKCDIDADPVDCEAGDGTATGIKYAASIWDGAPGAQMGNGFGACGDKTGFTRAEARAGGRIEIESVDTPSASATVDFGAFTFAAPAGWGGTGSAPYNQWWMKADATSNWDVHECETVVKTVNDREVAFNSCKVTVDIQGGSSGQTRYEVHPMNGGGCFVTGTNTPVMTDHTFWSSNPTPECEAEQDVTIGGLAMRLHQCSYTNVNPNQNQTGINMTCRHYNGRFTDAALTTSAQGENWDWNSIQRATLIANNAACHTAGSASNAAILAAYRCYAQPYFQHWDRDAGCSRDIQFRWSATTPQDFVIADYRNKPRGNIVTNVVTYSPDGKSWSVDDTEEVFTTVWQNSREITCRVRRLMKIQGTRISDTQMTMDVTMAGALVDRDAACLAAVKTLQEGGQIQGSGDLKHAVKAERWLFTANRAQ